MADDEFVGQQTNQDQSEDINDKLLLDLAWERQQKKTFAAWCNSHLRKCGAHLNEIDKDFRDGLLLLKLLELISGEKVAPAEKGKMRIHKITNVKKALEFISQKGVRLVGIGPEEIVDGNLKMTLGMIWTIILRFAIQDITVEELSAKDGLLLWCQRKTAPYKNVQVHNFHTSFKDGLAFCALIHRHRPDLLDYDSLKKSDDIHNLNLAFEIAETYLDIPKMLDAEDIHSTVKPDERAIMTYVSSYYHAFASNQQAETAAKRIGKVLTVNQENEKMMEDYEQMASNLLEWIQHTLPWLNERTSEKTLSDTKDHLEEFRQYSVSTKPPKAEEKGKLESHFHTLQTKLRLSNRPAYVPSEGKLVSDITAAWKALEAAEKSYQEFLEKELDRLRRLELLAQKFEHKANALEQLFSGKEAQLSYNDDIAEASLADIYALHKIHETFETDLEAQSNRVSKLGDISNELENLEYHNTQAIKDRLESIRETCVNLKELSDDRRKRIDEAVARQECLDKLRLEFAKFASALNNWIENSADDLHGDFSCSSIEEARTCKSKFEEFKSNELVEKSQEHEKICSFVEEIGQHGSTENPYSALSPEDVEQKWKNFMDLIEQHTAAIESELERQIEHEKFRTVFAEKANKAGEYIEAKSAQLADLSMSVGAGTMEEQLDSIKAFLADGVASQADYDEAEVAHQDIQAALIFTNPHTTYTIEALRSSWSQLIGSINRAINETENQILIRDSKGLSEEQLKEYRSSFNHFDRDNSGMLDKNEYRSCLLSLGYNLGSDPNNDPRFDDLWTKVDPNETGHVTFELFVDFMTRETVDQDTSEQVLASFKILAGDKPYITADLLKKELPPDQAEYCISRMAPYEGPGAVEGVLDYRSFSSALYGQSEL